VFWDENGEPEVHLHAALGHHGQTMTPCVTQGNTTHLILEAYLIEITGLHATRPWFPSGQFNRLTFSGEP